jgi:Eukaryotic DNA topoisomerase I, catalytic core
LRENAPRKGASSSLPRSLQLCAALSLSPFRTPGGGQAKRRSERRLFNNLAYRRCLSAGQSRNTWRTSRVPVESAGVQMLDAEIRISVDVDMPAPPGLRYVCDSGPAIRRRRAGKGFVYFDAKGRRIANADTLQRIRSLIIPPAWTDVWICAAADGHIQATGRDAKGRKQCKYHAEYREAREQSKYEHLFDFASALPTIRATVAEHMSLRGLPREKVLATVVHLLETTLIRVGNDEYARNNQSYGLTTLKSDHVAVEGTEVRFQFTGKRGKQWSLAMRDRRVARIVRACQSCLDRIFCNISTKRRHCTQSHPATSTPT